MHCAQLSGSAPIDSLAPVLITGAWAVRHCRDMREKATLRLDNGKELRVELEREDLARDQIVVRLAAEDTAKVSSGLIAVIDEHLEMARRHPAGTTDRLLHADRERPY